MKEVFVRIAMRLNWGVGIRQSCGPAAAYVSRLCIPQPHQLVVNDVGGLPKAVRTARVVEPSPEHPQVPNQGTELHLIAS